MRVDRFPNRTSPPAFLLRETYREDGKVKKRTLANITHWPAGKIEALRRLLRDEYAPDLKLMRSLPHGHVAAALDAFGFDPKCTIALDVGASTGGFTEVLLARGARRVYAVDVGRDQLHSRLRERPEIISIEGTDIRRLDPALLPERPEFVTIDASFISLRLLLPAVLELLQTPAHLLALIKPQFEAGRTHVKKGIVRDPLVHAAVCDDIASFVTSCGWHVRGIVASPIAGGDGNREFFIGAHRT